MGCGFVSRYSRVVLLQNPRHGRGDGWSGGLCCGVLTGLKYISDNLSVRFTLKLDTDALIISPFSVKICQRLEELGNIGIIGTYRNDPNGKTRDFSSWTQSLNTYLEPVKLRGRHLQIALWGAARRIQDALKRAVANGYRFAENCQGGAYAVNADLLKKMDAYGYFNHPLDWLHSGIGEDIMMGVYARACGLDLADFNRDQEPFGVQHQGLPYDLEELVHRGYSIIHSIKNDERHSESYITEFFRRSMAMRCDRAV